MLQMIPRHVPSLRRLLDDIGAPSAADLARSLGVSKRSAERWIRAGDAPRPVLLALFWVSRWGRSEAECEAHNAASLAAALASARERECVALRVEISRLLRVGDFGCANDASTFSAPPLHVLPLHAQAAV